MASPNWNPTWVTNYENYDIGGTLEKIGKGVVFAVAAVIVVVVAPILGPLVCAGGLLFAAYHGCLHQYHWTNSNNTENAIDADIHKRKAQIQYRKAIDALEYAAAGAMCIVPIVGVLGTIAYALRDVE